MRSAFRRLSLEDSFFTRREASRGDDIPDIPEGVNSFLLKPRASVIKCYFHGGCRRVFIAADL